MMTPEQRVAMSRKAARALNAGNQTLEFDNQIRAEVIAHLSTEAPLSDEVQRFIDRYGKPKDDTAATPLTAAEKDRLLTEVIMGVAEKNSKVPYTAESRKLRKRYRADVRDMKAKGYMPEVAKD